MASNVALASRDRSFEAPSFFPGDPATLLKAGIIKIASELSSPISNAHENFRRISVVDVLNPQSYKIVNYVRKIFLFGSLLCNLFVSIFTTLPGIVLRGVVTKLEKEPFIHLTGLLPEKKLPANKTFTMLTWNVCCINGGYAISNAGVVPWHDRKEVIVDAIKKTNADVVCLQEIFDANAAFYFYQALKGDYAHFYFNIGARAVGVSSGIFIASKYPIANPEFVPFPVETLINRTSWASKGFFSFNLQHKKRSFARIYATHLTHSAQPEKPTQKEVACRRTQMELIASRVNKVKNKTVLVTGDLNLGDKEYALSRWKRHFVKGDQFKDPARTWGGDWWCGNKVGDPTSRSLNLDHTLLVKGSALSIKTDLVGSRFNSKKYTRHALSDHRGLNCRVRLKK